jgi:phospholipid/cholesterol/gamma-HCH transport system substrate-binding protein
VNRRVAINLGAFVVVFMVMLFWAVNNIVVIDALTNPYPISADFAQAAGVRSNSEVTYLGVHYGRVSGVARRPGGVRIKMEIDRTKQIPEGSIARIFRKSAIGEPYIDFQPPANYSAADTRHIPAHEIIPESRTTTPLEFSDLLRSAGALLSSIDPNKAGSLIHELSLALDGRGQSLRDLTTGIDAITTTLAARTEALDRLARNNTLLTSVLAQHRLSIGQSITNLRAVTDALQQSKGDLASLLETGPQFLTITANLVADEKRNLDCLLTDLAPTIRLASSQQKLADLTSLLVNGPIGFGYVFDAVDHDPDGPWIRVDLVLPVGATPPKQYNPRPTLPVVPTISPCGSTLNATAIVPGPTGTTVTTSATTAKSATAAVVVPAKAIDVVRTPAVHTGDGAPPIDVLALVVLSGAIATLLTQRPRRGTEDR